jgi:hypothetical protein
MVTLAIVDRAPAGGRPDTWDLEIFEERLALRELIRRRVFQEVAEHNARRSGSFRGLVRPTDTERTLNGFRTREFRPVDAEAQYLRVLEAFSRNGFVVLVDDRQVEELDARVELRSGTEVTFLRLVPLVGG